MKWLDKIKYNHFLKKSQYFYIPNELHVIYQQKTADELIAIMEKIPRFDGYHTIWEETYRDIQKYRVFYIRTTIKYSEISFYPSSYEENEKFKNYLKELDNRYINKRQQESIDAWQELVDMFIKE